MSTDYFKDTQFSIHYSCRKEKEKKLIKKQQKEKKMNNITFP